MKWIVEVRNYRCFTDASPLRIDLSRPVTALIGPNNSGKTSALKFFWEFGPIIETAPRSIIAINQGGNNYRSYVGAQVRATSDMYSVFTESNQRPLLIDLIQLEMNFPSSEFEGSRNPYTGRNFDASSFSPTVLRIKVDRTNLHSEVFILHDGQELQVNDQTFRWVTNQHGTIFVHSENRIFYIDTNNGLDGIGGATFFPAVRPLAASGIAANHDLLFGHELVQAWNQYKLSGNSGARKVAARFENELARIFGYDRLEINSTATNDDFIVRPNNGNSLPMKDMGSGISHFLTVLFNVMQRGNQLVLIDEPEIGIHASLQVELMTLISKYANGPVLFATHSVGLARSVANCILSFQMKDEVSTVRNFEHSTNHLETLGELSFSAWREIGCDKVVFVEGVHDVKVMREWLKLLGKQFHAVVLPLGGSEFIRSDGVEAIKQVLEIHPKVAVVIDSELEGPAAVLESKRKAFSEGCELSDIPCLTTKLRATENYFPDSAVKEAMGPKAFAIGPFDQVKKVDCGWGKKDGFKIAAKMSSDEFRATDIGQFLLKSLS